MEKYYLGIDLGGTTTNIGLVSSEGQLVEERILNTLPKNGPENAFERIGASVDEIRNSLSKDQVIISTGVGIPGIYNKDEDRIEEASNLPGWKNINLGEVLHVTLDMNVFIDNDANMAALGEGWKGAGKDVPVSFMITLGTGVGGAIIQGNDIFTFNDFSGEFGHMIINTNGADCSCGRRGCLETFISKHGMERQAVELITKGKNTLLRDFYPDSLSPHVIAHAAEQGDAVALEIYEQAAHGLAVGIANISNVLGITVFILGGGITNAYHLIEPVLDRTLPSLVFDYQKRNIKVKKAELGEKAGLIGAAKFAMNQ